MKVAAFDWGSGIIRIPLFDEFGDVGIGKREPVTTVTVTWPERWTANFDESKVIELLGTTTTRPKAALAFDR